MHRRLVPLALAAAVVACDDPTQAAPAPQRFVATGTLNVRQWADTSVPGSLEQRPATRLPAYLVCEVADDPGARAAAVVDDARIVLYENGTVEFTLQVGSWLRRNGVVVASGATITRQGTWSESDAGRVTLSGLNLPGLGTDFEYTDIGARLDVALACPGGSSVDSLRPTLTLRRAP